MPLPLYFAYVGGVAILATTVMECLTRSSSGPSIPFPPLPPLSVPVSLPANSSESLAGYYSLASGVVNVLTPGKLPHSIQICTSTDGCIVPKVCFLCVFTAGAIVSIVTEQLDLDWGTQPLQNGTQGATSEVKLCSYVVQVYTSRLTVP